MGERSTLGSVDNAWAKTASIPQPKAPFPAFWTRIVGLVLTASLGMIASQIYTSLLDLSEGSVVHSTIARDLNAAHANVLQGLSQSNPAVRTTLFSLRPMLSVWKYTLFRMLLTD